MPDTADQPGAPPSASVSTAADDRSARWVGVGLFTMIVALVVALIVISGAANPGLELTLFTATITHDQVLLLGVLTAGALGGCIHVATSFSDYVGNAQYRARWEYWYVMRPFIGACLATAFYFLLRGGLLSLASPAAANPQQSPSFYGVTAIAFLVGMFSKQATDKLDDVFDTLFKSNKDADRKDSLDATKPVATRLNPDTAPLATEQVVEIQGTNFVAGAQVQVNGTARAATGGVSATSVKVTLTAADLAQAGEIKLAVVNPDKAVSNELAFKVVERREQPGSPDDRGAGAGAGQGAPAAGQQGAPAGGQQAPPAGGQQAPPADGEQAAPVGDQQAPPAGDQQAAPVGAGAGQGGVGSGMGVDGDNADGTSG